MIQYPRTTGCEIVAEIFVAIFPGVGWLIRFNACRYHNIEGLRNFSGAGSLCAIPVNTLFYDKAQSNKSKYDVHRFGCYFKSADASGASTFQVNLVFRFPYRGADRGIMTKMLSATRAIGSR